MYVIDGMEAGLNYIKLSAPSIYERILTEVGGQTDGFDFKKRMIVSEAVIEAFEMSGIDVIKVSESRYQGLGALLKVLTKKKKLSISGKYRVIEEACFSRCANLESIVFEEGVVQINDGVMRNQMNLKQVSFPNSLRSIGEGAFINCKNLCEVRFGNPRTRMYSHSFAGTKWFEEKKDEFVVINGQLLRYHGSGENIVIPNGTISIECGAFNEDKNVKTVRCPESLEEIRVCAFENCANLEKMILNDHLKYIGYHAFVGCDNLKEVVLPRNFKEMQYEAFDPDIVIWYYNDDQELREHIECEYPKSKPIN